MRSVCQQEPRLLFTSEHHSNSPVVSDDPSPEPYEVQHENTMHPRWDTQLPSMAQYRQWGPQATTDRTLLCCSSSPDSKVCIGEPPQEVPGTWEFSTNLCWLYTCNSNLLKKEKSNVPLSSWGLSWCIHYLTEKFPQD